MSKAANGIEQLEAYLTPKDRERTRALWALADLARVLAYLDQRAGRDRMLDMGCGFGGLSMAMGKRLGMNEVHGVDIDVDALAEAEQKGVKASRCEVGKDRLPYPDNSFDLLTSFGMLDYLPFFDDAMREIFRVIKPEGYVVVSLPNLASWYNRLALLLGYQPRDIEVSREVVPGIHPYYRKRGSEPTGHIHAVTTGAFRELAEHFGFTTTLVLGGCPSDPKTGGLLKSFDQLMARRPTLAKRFYYFGQKRLG
ncbi:MAG: methyltransferase domain-containing protein [Candidatus Methylomirabilales bacterium]